MANRRTEGRRKDTLIFLFWTAWYWNLRTISAAFISKSRCWVDGHCNKVDGSVGGQKSTKFRFNTPTFCRRGFSGHTWTTRLAKKVASSSFSSLVILLNSQPDSSMKLGAGMQNTETETKHKVDSLGANNNNTLDARAYTINNQPSSVPREIYGYRKLIKDPNLRITISQIQKVNVSVPEFVTPDEHVELSYVHWPAVTRESSPSPQPDKGDKNVDEKKIPILLLPGFDCSCLGFYHLGPLLSKMGHDAYAVDILGWGETQLQNVSSFSGESKLEALIGFWKTVLVAKHQNPSVCLLGASVGAAPALELVPRMARAINCNNVFEEGDNKAEVELANPVKAVILVSGVLYDASFMKYLPMPWIKFCVTLLGIPIFRKVVEGLSCWDKSELDDSIQVWEHNRQREGWEYAQESFIKSGGFPLSEQHTSNADVMTTPPPTLSIWGEKDILQRIMQGPKQLPKLLNYGKPDSAPEQRKIKNCGHFPHSEKPKETATIIEEFLLSVDPPIG